MPLSRRASASRLRPLAGQLDDGAPGVVGVGLLGDPALLDQLTHGAGDRRLRGAVGLGQRGHPERPQLVEQRQDPDAGRLPDPTAYGAHQAGGLDDELAALLLEVAGHAGRIPRTPMDRPPSDGTMTPCRRTSRSCGRSTVGKRKFSKEAIVAACEAAGFTDVVTYINTGNVRVTTPMRSRAKVEAALEKAFEAEAGFDVPTIVLTPKELTRRRGVRRARSGAATRGATTSRC